MLLELHPGLGLYSLGTSLSMLGLGQAMCRRLSELPANGAGPPCAAPWRLNNAGIVLAPFVSPLPPRPGPPPCSATFPMPAWLMGAWDSTRGALGLELADPPAWEHPAYSGSSWRCQSSMLSLKLPQLLQVHQVPRVFWEDGIMSGYRCPTSSALDCVLSSFQLTNETVNIWTHFLPTWYFLWRLLALVGGPSFRTEPYHWPLLIFLLPACLYPFASCCAHTFSSMSARARHICYFLDYGALSLYSLGSAFPYAAYSMPASWLHSRLHQLFVPTAALNSFLCTGLSCYSRFPELESPRLSKVLRTAAFAYPFLFDNLPLFYRKGWPLGASTTLATATSCSMSVRCWAPTSSWRPCWLTWDRAEPGWPGRKRRRAWLAWWPHWAWQWPETCSSSPPSQPGCFGPLPPAPWCRAARHCHHWAGLLRLSASETASLSLAWARGAVRG
ncbi:membrane progestin receptor delta isoform X3 [Ochotona princeps]|uniref:membrane progestin receptor delta isoform X3 n=1 Tax=Ochotona princeps TaxID=9978 RepID=UPI0027152F42|nr:membrane progestin receptor delta isoform X3 [Ochotona princeps]